MAGHLVYELIKSGAELYEGEEAAHKPGWDNKVKGTLGLASGGLSAAGAVFGAGGALAAEAGLGVGGALAGAGSAMGVGGAVGGAGLAGFLAGTALDHWLGLSDKMAGVGPAEMDRFHAAHGMDHRQAERGAAGLAADQRAHNPVAALANETRAQMNRVEYMQAINGALGNYAR